MWVCWNENIEGFPEELVSKFKFFFEIKIISIEIWNDGCAMSIINITWNVEKCANFQSFSKFSNFCESLQAFFLNSFNIYYLSNNNNPMQ